jgi:aspartyl protease family protein
MNRIGSMLLTFLLLLPVMAGAADSVRVVALFPDKAMVEVDGHNRLLRVGERSPEGLLLISADAHEAVIEVDGKRDTYLPGSRIGGTFSTPQKREVRITRDSDGSYNTVGSINGQIVNMLVDTGASSIAMSEVQAKRLGIPYWLDGEKMGVQTASGYARAYGVTLKRVQVGEITLHDVAAVVVEGDNPTSVLLGMTFLNRVDLEHQGNVMVLRTKY